VLALPWLALCAIYDLRSRSVPAWLIIPPLLLAVVWIAWQGTWAVAILVVTLFFLDDLPWRMRGFLAGLQGILLMFAWQQAGLDAVILGIVLILIWLFWKLGAFGGADAQVLMALALVFQPAVLVPIAVAGGIHGLIQRARGKTSLPAMLAIFIGTGILLLGALLPKL